MKTPAAVLALLACFLALPVLTGCGLTAAETRQIAAEAATQTAAVVESRAYEKAVAFFQSSIPAELAKAKAGGATEADLAVMEAKLKADADEKARAAAKAAADAVQAAGTVAGEVAAKKAADEKGTQTGAVVSGIIVTVLGLLGAALKKGASL